MPGKSAIIGYVALKDTGRVKEYLNVEAIHRHLPGDIWFALRQPRKDRKMFSRFMPSGPSDARRAGTGGRCD